MLWMNREGGRCLPSSTVRREINSKIHINLKYIFSTMDNSMINKLSSVYCNTSNCILIQFLYKRKQNLNSLT